MAKLKKHLNALMHSLGIQEALRDRAVRRMTARHKGQKKAERQKVAAEDAAERLRRDANHYLTFGPDLDQVRGERLLRRAGRKEKKAQRLEAKAEREKRRAVVWKGRARKLTNRIHGIKTDIDQVKGEIAEFGPKVDFENSQVKGGSFAARWRLSNLTSVRCCQNSRRRNAYSQAGAPDIWHPYGPGPAAGRRDDCSTFVTSQALATGADDPNGCDFRGEGYTGTLIGAHGRWKQVTLNEMIAAGQGYIVYGDGPGYHTEAYCPSKTDKLRTVGHGSAPVDFSTIHMFRSGTTERYYIYV